MKTLLLTAALALTACSLALAQSPGSGGPAPGVAPTETPLDGGASLLLAGGIGYAVRRLRLRVGKLGSQNLKHCPNKPRRGSTPNRKPNDFTGICADPLTAAIMITATLFIPQQRPTPMLPQGLSCEPDQLDIKALCAAAELLGVEVFDVQAFCVNPVTGVMAYMGGEWQKSATMRNVAVERALNQRLPGRSFFGGLDRAHTPAACLFGTVLLVERSS